MSKSLDANGQEITAGCTVRHRHEPADLKAAAQSVPPETYHNFFGTAKVKRVLGNGHVLTEQCNHRRHIPVHLPQNLVVVG